MIRQILLDLDNTVYPSTSVMEQEVLRRMNEFTSLWMGIGYDEAVELRRHRMPSFGTTLEWLMTEQGLSDADAYYEYVHPEGEEACLNPDPALAAYLSGWDLPLSIFTNAPSEHAERVLRKLGCREAFDRIYDIRFCGYRGKPYPGAFKKVCADLGIEPGEILFVDDVPRYVRGFLSVGGRGILIDDMGRHEGSELTRVGSLYELKGMIESGFFRWNQPDLFARDPFEG